MMSESLQSIFNFQLINDQLATSGQPTIEQFRDIRRAGYQLVVNLALPTSTNAIENEQSIVESLGMQYIHIPVEWENPTLNDFENFLMAMNTNADRPIFVHCAMNMRVSAFMYLYQRIHRHLSDEQAKVNLEKIWLPNETWQQFIQMVLDHHTVEC
jgi:protein tyrosine phosphatase (PTP) superfamily phosphohydrolase (DUF442 family)